MLIGFGSMRFFVKIPANYIRDLIQCMALHFQNDNLEYTILG